MADGEHHHFLDFRGAGDRWPVLGCAGSLEHRLHGLLLNWFPEYKSFVGSRCATQDIEVILALLGQNVTLHVT